MRTIESEYRIDRSVLDRIFAQLPILGIAMTPLLSAEIGDPYCIILEFFPINTCSDQKDAPPLIVNDRVRCRIKVGCLAAMRFVNLELMREVELYLTCMVGFVGHRNASHKYRTLIVDNIFKRQFHLKIGMLCDDRTRECIFFAPYRYLPRAIFAEPTHTPADPYADAVNVVAAHMVFVPHMRIIQIAHQTIIIECSCEFAVGKDDGTGHINACASDRLEVANLRARSYTQCTRRTEIHTERNTHARRRRPTTWYTCSKSDRRSGAFANPREVYD